MKNIIYKMLMALIFGKRRKLVECLDHYNFKRGMELLNAGDQSGAFRYFTDEISEYNENGFAHGHIARIHYDNKMYGAALNAANKAIRYLKLEKEALSSSYCLRAEINWELGNEQDMFEDLATAIKLDPDETEPYKIRARWYFQHDDYEKSMSDLKKIAEIEPGNPFPFAAIGFNLLEQDKIDEAQEHFEYSILLDPNYASAYSFLADCKFQQGDIAGCIDDCITCLSLDADDDKALNILLCQVMAQDSNMFDSKLKVRIQQEPNIDTWPRVLALGYSAREEYYQSIKMWHVAHDIKPKPVYLFLIADNYIHLGDYQRAEKYLHRALADDNDNYEAHLNLGDVLLSQIRYEEALQEYEICNRIRPDDTSVLNKLADTYRIMKCFDKALEYAQMSVSLEQWSSDGWLTLAQIYEMQGNMDKQKEALEKLVSLDQPISNHKAIALAFLGRYSEALGEIEGNLGDECENKDAYHWWVKAYILVIAGRIDEAYMALKRSFELGFRDFESIQHIDIYQCMRQLPNLDMLVNNWRAQAMLEFQEQNRVVFGAGETGGTEHVIAIPFTSSNGEWNVRVEVNGLPLTFELDTGAYDVLISEVEANFMRKNGYLEEKDFGGERCFLTATGEAEEGTHVNIREMKLGQLVLRNIRATVAKNQKASLLLGKSVIGRFAKMEVDHKNMVIRFTTDAA